MPYSEHAAWVQSLLVSLSSIRIQLSMYFATWLTPLALPHADLHGKTAIVTGANSGIGYQVARVLASMGARVVLACRNPQRGEDARQRIAKETGNDKVELEILDCESFASVHAFLERWGQRETKQVDILINNAGLSYSNLTKTPDAFEVAYQCNHLSHVLLTHTLLSWGYFAPKARIVSVSAFGFYRSIPLDERNADASHILSKYALGKPLPYEAMMQTYRGSKAGQAIWTIILQRKLDQSEKVERHSRTSMPPRHGQIIHLVPTSRHRILHRPKSKIIHLTRPQTRNIQRARRNRSSPARHRGRTGSTGDARAVLGAYGLEVGPGLEFGEEEAGEVVGQVV
ncbi:hypothetical protein FRC08_003318 [Ceratobasidium sp. 394]|nr:hypothetical protein FRC08_003318 [Ceratobasidium sp. 394]